MKYVAFVHQEDGVFGISFPDFPGCISAGDHFDEAIQNGIDALALHIEGLAEDGGQIAAPRSIQEVNADRSIDDLREGAVLVLI